MIILNAKFIIIFFYNNKSVSNSYFLNYIRK